MDVIRPTHNATLERDFAAVYDEHVWRVYGYFAYRLRARGDAEDFTQLTFERVPEGMEALRRRAAERWHVASPTSSVRAPSSASANASSSRELTAEEA